MHSKYMYYFLIHIQSVYLRVKSCQTLYFLSLFIFVCQVPLHRVEKRCALGKKNEYINV